MLSILLWWAAPIAVAMLAAVVISVTRRVRAARSDVETLARYQRARAALARGAESGLAVRARQE